MRCHRCYAFTLLSLTMCSFMLNAQKKDTLKVKPKTGTISDKKPAEAEAKDKKR